MTRARGCSVKKTEDMKTRVEGPCWPSCAWELILYSVLRCSIMLDVYWYV